MNICTNESPFSHCSSVYHQLWFDPFASPVRFKRHCDTKFYWERFRNAFLKKNILNDAMLRHLVSQADGQKLLLTQGSLVSNHFHQPSSFILKLVITFNFGILIPYDISKIYYSGFSKFQTGNVMLLREY